MHKDDTPSTFWHYDHESRWFQKDERYQVDLTTISEFIRDSGFKRTPVLHIGSLLNFIQVYEHKNTGQYLFYFEIDNLSKIVFAESLPGMFYVLEELQCVLNGYLKTLPLLPKMKNE